MEPILHRLPAGADRQAIEALLEPGYFEVGASGAVYSRAHVIGVVEQRYRDGLDPDVTAYVVDDFSTAELAEQVYLVAYRLSQSGRLSRRSTVWRRHDVGWRAVYHQGLFAD